MVDAGLAAASDHPGLLTQRAQIDLFDGHPDEALQRLDRALAADPFRAESVYQRGLILRVLGRSPEASRDFARAAELNRLTIAMSDLNGKAAQDPHDADVRNRLGGSASSWASPTSRRHGIARPWRAIRGTRAPAGLAALRSRAAPTGRGPMTDGR